MFTVKLRSSKVSRAPLPFSFSVLAVILGVLRCILIAALLLSFHKQEKTRCFRNPFVCRRSKLGIWGVWCLLFPRVLLFFRRVFNTDGSAQRRRTKVTRNQKHHHHHHHHAWTRKKGRTEEEEWKSAMNQKGKADKENQSLHTHTYTHTRPSVRLFPLMFLLPFLLRPFSHRGPAPFPSSTIQPLLFSFFFYYSSSGGGSPKYCRLMYRWTSTCFQCTPRQRSS